MKVLLLPTLLLLSTYAIAGCGNWTRFEIQAEQGLISDGTFKIGGEWDCTKLNGYDALQKASDLYDSYEACLFEPSTDSNQGLLQPIDFKKATALMYPYSYQFCTSPVLKSNRTYQVNTLQADGHDGLEFIFTRRR